MPFASSQCIFFIHTAKGFNKPRESNPDLLLAEYTLPESTSLGGVEVGVAMPDSSQSLPPLMHMGYAAAATRHHPGTTPSPSPPSHR